MTEFVLLAPFALVAVAGVAAAALGPVPRPAKLRRITLSTAGLVALLALDVLAARTLDDPGEVGYGYGGLLFGYLFVLLVFALAALVPFVAVHAWRRRRARSADEPGEGGASGA